MPKAQTSENMSPELRKVAARAERDPQAKFNSLAHLLDPPALCRAFERVAPSSSAGVDGVTKAEYARQRELNLAALHERLKAGKYRHQPIRRVEIPKEHGETRPIGIPCLEDKVVQGAVREVLEAIYEQDFLDCSYGFRPGRSAHDALRVLNRALTIGGVNYVLEADIRSFFDSLDHAVLFELLQQRVADGALLRLLRKFLHAGVLAGEELHHPEEGAPQGAVVSPLLANIYLHHVLDLWFERDVKPRLSGRAYLVRYADDFVMAFEREEDAKRVWEVLGKRMARYGLALHPDKTRLFPFGPRAEAESSGARPATFDFLGFTFYGRKSRKSKRWTLRLKTRRSRLRRAIKSASEWCRRYRHLSLKEQHRALTRKVLGHFQYFGVNGNASALSALVYFVTRSWRRWLSRRSQRGALDWKRMSAILRAFPLPKPRVYTPIWG
jgi:group II intron reverse transcriptase/maturase